VGGAVGQHWGMWGGGGARLLLAPLPFYVLPRYRGLQVLGIGSLAFRRSISVLRGQELLVSWLPLGCPVSDGFCPRARSSCASETGTGYHEQSNGEKRFSGLMTSNKLTWLISHTSCEPRSDSRIHPCTGKNTAI